LKLLNALASGSELCHAERQPRSGGGGGSSTTTSSSSTGSGRGGSLLATLASQLGRLVRELPARNVQDRALRRRDVRHEAQVMLCHLQQLGTQQEREAFPLRDAHAKAA
jgi:hypothetical protein